MEEDSQRLVDLGSAPDVTGITEQECTRSRNLDSSPTNPPLFGWLGEVDLPRRHNEVVLCSLFKYLTASGSDFCLFWLFLFTYFSLEDFYQSYL